MRFYDEKSKTWKNPVPASEVPIADVLKVFDSDNTEGALQELAGTDKKLEASINNINSNLETMEETIEWMKQHGGGGTGPGTGGSILPTLTSDVPSELVISKGEDLIIPIFFSSPNLGGGSLVCIINGKQKPLITLKQGSVMANLGKLTDLQNTVKIYARDRAGLLSNEITFKVINGGVGLSLNFDTTADYPVAEAIIIPYIVEAPTLHTELHFTIDNNETIVECSDGYNEYTLTNVAPGIHKVQMKVQSGEYTSEIYNFNLIIINSDELYLSTTYESASHTLGIPIVIPYRLSYKDNSNISVVMTLTQNGVPVRTNTTLAPRGNYAWTLNGIAIGNFEFRIVATLDGATSEITGSFVVEAGRYTPVQGNIQGLQYRINPIGRSNVDADCDEFEYEGITARLHNINHVTNGWVDNVLRLSAGAYAEIDFSPWEDNAINGSTIELTFKSTYTGKSNAILTYADTQSNKGAIIESEKAYIGSATKQALASLYPGEKTTLTFVLDRTSEKKFAKIYINGICTRAFMLSDNGSGYSAVYENMQFSNGKLYLNCDNNLENAGILDIYDFRIYRRALTPMEVTRNYVSEETDMVKQEALYNFLYDNTSLPTMRLTGDTSRMTNTIKCDMTVDYSSPNTELFGQPIDNLNCKVYWQGTSSLDYIRKNYNIELYDEFNADYYYTPFENGVPERLFCLKCDYMESSHARNIGIARFVDKYMYTTPNPAQLEDERVRNTIQGFPILLYVNDEFMGVYNFNTDRYSSNSFGYTDEQNHLVYEISANSNTTAGAFCKYTTETEPNKLLFYTDSLSSTNTFNGYGFSSGYIKVTPGSQLRFNPGSAWTLTDIEILTYKSKNNQRVSAINKNATITLGSDINYIRVNGGWGNKTFINNAPATININGKDIPIQVTSEANSINIEYVEGTTDITGGQTEQEYYASSFSCVYPPTRQVADDFAEVKRLVEFVDTAGDEEFVANLDRYFNREYLLRYYIFATLFGAVDSLGKNMKIASWDGGNIWYLQVYDADTTIGLDNMGNDKFESDIEIGDEVASVPVYNTTASKLWTKVKLLLQNEIIEQYAILRNNGLTLDNLYECIVEGQMGRIPATFYNEDMQTKYLQFGTSYLYALHGSDEQRVRLWLRDRLQYLDTMWDYDVDNTDFLTIRSGATGQLSMDITVLRSMYVKVKWKNDPTGASTQKYRVRKGGSTTFRYVQDSADQEIRVFGGNNILDLGDLSALQPTNMILSNAINLQDLECHSSALINLDIAGCTNITSVDISNCVNLGTSDNATVLDVSGCDELDYLDLRGTALQGVQVNENGSNIREIWLPKTLTSVTFNNFPRLETLGLQEGHSIQNLTIIDCPNLKQFGDREYDATTKLPKWSNGKFLSGIQRLHLDNSYLDSTSLEIIYPVGIREITLNNMPVLEDIRLGVNTLENSKGNYDFVTLIENSNDLTINVENCPKLKSFYTTGRGRNHAFNENENNDTRLWNDPTRTDLVPSFSVFLGLPLSKELFYWSCFRGRVLDLSNTQIENIYLYSATQVKGIKVPTTLKNFVSNKWLDTKEKFKVQDYTNSNHYTDIISPQRNTLNWLYVHGNGSNTSTYATNGGLNEGLWTYTIVPNIWSSNVPNFNPSMSEGIWDFQGLSLSNLGYSGAYLRLANNSYIGNNETNLRADPLFQYTLRNLDYAPEQYCLSLLYFKAFNDCNFDFSNYEGESLNYALANITDNSGITFTLPNSYDNVITMENVLNNVNTTKIEWCDEIVEEMFSKMTNISQFRNIYLKEQEQEDERPNFENSNLTSLVSASMFRDTNLKYIGNISLPNVTSLSNSFNNVTNLVEIGDITAPKCSGFYSLFVSMPNLEIVGRIYSGVPVTNMGTMCRYNSKLRSIELDFTLDNANMDYAFNGCASLTVNISLRGTSNRTRSAFEGCSNLTYLDLNDFTMVTSDSRNMLKGCRNLGSIKLKGSCTNAENMCSGSTMTELNISELDLSSCTSFTNTFQGFNISELDFTGTNINNNNVCTNTQGMFWGAVIGNLTGFDYIPNSVSYASYMFQDADVNGNLPIFRASSNCTTINYMYMDYKGNSIPEYFYVPSNVTSITNSFRYSNMPNTFTLDLSEVSYLLGSDSILFCAHDLVNVTIKFPKYVYFNNFGSENYEAMASMLRRVNTIRTINLDYGAFQGTVIGLSSFLYEIGINGGVDNSTGLVFNGFDWEKFGGNPGSTTGITSIKDFTVHAPAYNTDINIQGFRMTYDKYQKFIDEVLGDLTEPVKPQRTLTLSRYCNYANSIALTSDQQSELTVRAVQKGWNIVFV